MPSDSTTPVSTPPVPTPATVFVYHKDETQPQDGMVVKENAKDMFVKDYPGTQYVFQYQLVSAKKLTLIPEHVEVSDI